MDETIATDAHDGLLPDVFEAIVSAFVNCIIADFDANPPACLLVRADGVEHADVEDQAA